MGQIIKFIVDYEVEGAPIVYVADEEVVTFERTKEGVFECHMDFDMHVATEEELKEYKNRNK